MRVIVKYESPNALDASSMPRTNYDQIIIDYLLWNYFMYELLVTRYVADYINTEGQFIR